MIVSVVEHDPVWKAAYEEEAQRIIDALDEHLLNAFHIGSTNVPGLTAEPIIDILLVVDSIADMDSLNERFTGLHYEAMGESGVKGRRYYRKGGEKRTHQIHAFQFDNLWDIERHLVFKEYLKAHPAVRDTYGNLKNRLARSFPNDVERYSEGKHEFIRAVEREALRWHYKNRRKAGCAR